MPLFIDSHVHFYPCFDAEKMFRSFARRTRACGAAEGAMVLVERQGQNTFETWRKGENLPRGFSLRRSEQEGLLFTPEDPKLPSVAVIAGRQIVCAERIEVLSIGSLSAPPDGLEAAAAINAILQEDAQPVLAWGAGKWLGARKHVVENLLKRFAPDELMIGDSSLRPFFWGEPDAMMRAPSFGRRVLHGSDPLPCAFETTRAGQYGDLAENVLREDAPLRDKLLSVLRNEKLSTAGRRAGAVEFLRRMLRK